MIEFDLKNVKGLDYSRYKPNSIKKLTTTGRSLGKYPTGESQFAKPNPTADLIPFESLLWVVSI